MKRVIVEYNPQGNKWNTRNLWDNESQRNGWTIGECEQDAAESFIQNMISMQTTPPGFIFTKPSIWTKHRNGRHYQCRRPGRRRATWKRCSYYHAGDRARWISGATVL